MTENIFIIKGMHCQSCAILIEGELIDLSGIKNAQVDYRSGKATVVYDENLVNESDFIQVVEKLGDYQMKGTR